MSVAALAGGLDRKRAGHIGIEGLTVGTRGTEREGSQAGISIIVIIIEVFGIFLHRGWGDG
jgi:hypothetical protein